MALPEGYDYKKYLPTREDFEAVSEAKRTNRLWKLHSYPKQGEEPYFYEVVRTYLTAIILKWNELARDIESRLLRDRWWFNNKVPFTKEDLAEIRALCSTHKEFIASIYKDFQEVAKNLEAPTDRLKAACDNRTGQIKVKNDGKGVFYIIPYSMKYNNGDPNKTQTGARMHIFFGRKVGNQFKIVIRGCNLYGSGKDKVKDQPYFLTEQEARDFIANFDHNHLDTKVTIEQWRFVISNKPLEDGRKEIGRRVYNGVDYGPEWGKNIRAIEPDEVVKVDTSCGAAYMLKTCKYLKAEEGLEEAVEKHETLNPKLFDGMELKQEVKDKVEEITNEMIRLLNDEEIKLEVRDVVITGSNASYNYTKDSDIDVHILAKTSDLDDHDKVYPKLYNAYRRIFASKYDISFYGIPVEVYIEVEGNETVSNGCYSVMFDHWVKEPSAVAIPEIDQKAIDEAAKPWKEEAQALLDKNNIEAIDDYINRLYELRQKGLYSSDGVEYSTENLIFKEVRNDGFLDKLKQHRDELTSQELSLESLEEAIDEKTRRDYVVQITRLTHYQPVVHPNGHFEIHLVKEDDVQYVLTILRRQNWVEDCHSAPGKFDFSHVSSFNLPSRYHTVMGRIRV